MFAIYLMTVIVLKLHTSKLILRATPYRKLLLYVEFVEMCYKNPYRERLGDVRYLNMCQEPSSWINEAN